jgi:two-component system KDP operon response regulator KdpE
VLLGLDLPDIDGVEVCAQLRRWSTAPIIVVTVDDREHRKIAAFDAGADDYVVSPFSIPELLARVRRAMRRTRTVTGAEQSVIIAGPLRIDIAAHVATVSGQSLRLTAKEFAILSMLARSPQQLTTYRTLLAGVWGDRGRIEHLRARVNSLRRKLETASDDIGILTEPGAGYRLVHSAAQ